VAGVKRLLVVQHSQSGGTATLVGEALAGAREAAGDAIEVVARDALDATPEDVLHAQAVLLGTPENFGYMSGALKYFFDRVYYPCLEHTQGLPYALLIKAGNDGSGARAAVARIATGLRWREVQAPLIVVGELTPEALAAARELGMTMAAGLELGLY
jgi:multimeric flavodoxin WrbA